MGGFEGFGSMLSSFIDTAVSSSDRRAANELNYWSTMDTNKTNADINDAQLAAARENWKREQQNFELQRKWALEDRDYENSYNSPINVRNRLLQAGINPALAMSGQGGVVSAPSSSAKPAQAPSFGSPPSSIPMQAAHFEPTMPNGLGLSDAMVRSIELMQQSERNQTDISAIRQRVANETAETKAKIVSMGKKNEETDKIIRKLNQDILFNEDSYEERMRSIKLGNDKLKADQAYTEAQTASIQFANEIAPEVHNWNRQRFAMDLEVASAQVAELMARKDLTDQEKDLVIQKIAEQTVRNSNLPKTLHNDNAIQVATYNQIKKSGLKLEQETRNLEWIEKDLRKGYRQHTGSDRSLEDIIEVTLKRNKNGARMPSMQ